VNDLEGHSMSSPLLPFDRSYTISHLSSIVSVSLFCTVFEILTLICQKVKTLRDLDHADLGDSIVVARLILHGPNRAKNLKTSFSRSEDISWGVKF